MRCTFGLGFSFAVALAVAVPPALAQQAASFNRLTTTRRESMAGPNRVGQNGVRSASPNPHPNSSWNQEPRREPPVSNRVSTTPHTYYPGMRAGQSINRNVAQRRCTQGRAGFLTSGAMNSLQSRGAMSSIPSRGAMNSVPSRGGVHR